MELLTQCKWQVLKLAFPLSPLVSDQGRMDLAAPENFYSANYRDFNFQNLRGSANEAYQEL